MTQIHNAYSNAMAAHFLKAGFKKYLLLACIFLNLVEFNTVKS